MDTFRQVSTLSPPPPPQQSRGTVQRALKLGLCPADAYWGSDREDANGVIFFSNKAATQYVFKTVFNLSNSDGLKISNFRKIYKFASKNNIRITTISQTQFLTIKQTFLNYIHFPKLRRQQETILTANIFHEIQNIQNMAKGVIYVNTCFYVQNYN